MTQPDGPPPLTDQQLVELALQDDQGAFRELVSRYRQQIFAVASAIVGDWDMADSATHETFVRAFRGLDGYKPEFTFSGWLARIARNVSLNRVQKKKIAMLAIEGSAYADTDEAVKFTALQVPAGGESPLQQVLSREREAQIFRAIADLRPQYREALLLLIEQLSHEEIARRMGVPVNTVRTYLKRGRDKPKKALREQSLATPG